MPRRIEIACGESDEGISLEMLLRRKGVSRRLITLLKRTEQGLTRDGALCRTIDIIHSGDVVVMNIPDGSGFHVEPNSSLNVNAAYEDDDVIVYDKPFGMPVHQSLGHYGDTLANAFASRFPDIPFRAVNRLDKDTSGLCIVSKNRMGANIRDISKVYYAVCCGELKEHLHIDAPIARERESAMKRIVSDDGAPSVTDAYPLKTNGEYTLVKLILGTGRTHQIRVHMSYAGFPLAGDSMYGGDMSRIGRQALHCGEMRFVHPVTGQTISVSSPIPEDMASLADQNHENT